VEERARGYRVGTVCRGAGADINSRRERRTRDTHAVVRTLLQHPETDPNTRDNQGERGG
jgi:hypothetical protein